MKNYNSIKKSSAGALSRLGRVLSLILLLSAVSVSALADGEYYLRYGRGDNPDVSGDYAWSSGSTPVNNVCTWNITPVGGSTNCYIYLCNAKSTSNIINIPSDISITDNGGISSKREVGTWSSRNYLFLQLNSASEFTISWNISTYAVTLGGGGGSSCTFYIQYPFNGGDWTWSPAPMTDNGDGSYSYVGQYGNTAGFDVNTTASNDGKCYYGNLTVPGGISTGDLCTFTFTPASNCAYLNNVGTAAISTYTSNINVYVYDESETLDALYVHYWGGATGSVWPGAEAVKVKQDDHWFKATIPSDHTNLIYSDGTIANKTKDISIRKYNGTSVGFYDPTVTVDSKKKGDTYNASDIWFNVDKVTGGVHPDGFDGENLGYYVDATLASGSHYNKVYWGADKNPQAANERGNITVDVDGVNTTFSLTTQTDVRIFFDPSPAADAGTNLNETFVIGDIGAILPKVHMGSAPTVTAGVKATVNAYIKATGCLDIEEIRAYYSNTSFSEAPTTYSTLSGGTYSRGYEYPLDILAADLNQIISGTGLVHVRVAAKNSNGWSDLSDEICFMWVGCQDPTVTVTPPAQTAVTPFDQFTITAVAACNIGDIEWSYSSTSTLVAAPIMEASAGGSVLTVKIPRPAGTVGMKFNDIYYTFTATVKNGDKTATGSCEITLTDAEEECPKP